MPHTPPDHHHSNTSPYPPAVSDLLGHRPSISTLISSVNGAFSALKQGHKRTRNQLEKVLHVFNEEEHWAGMTEEQRVKLLRLVEEDAEKVKSEIIKGIYAKDLPKEIRNVTTLYQDAGVGPFHGGMLYTKVFSPRNLLHLVGLIQQNLHRWLGNNSSDWKAANEVFTRTVLMDLYPDEAEMLEQELRLILEQHAANESPEQLLATVTEERRTHLLTDAFLHPENQNERFRTSVSAHSSRMHSRRNSGADRLDPFAPEANPYGGPASFMHYERSLRHPDYHRRPVFTPRQAQRYGRSPAEGAWA